MLVYSKISPLLFNGDYSKESVIGLQNHSQSYAAEPPPELVFQQQYALYIVKATPEEHASGHF